MPKAAPRPKAADKMLDLISGYWISQLVFVAAKLGIADALAKGPRTPAAIAKRAGADASAVRRVLRALASIGVFAEGAGGRFRLTPLAQTLRSDRPDSLRSFALMMVDDYNWDAWGRLSDGVLGGGVPFQQVHQMPIFEYLRRHPDKEATFAASMASISGMENAAVATAYPFGRCTRLVDVGGAHGHLLATILLRHPALEGVLYDQVQVVAHAADSGFVSQPGVRERCQLVGGNFFRSVPAGADAYIMKYVLHDWDDERCVRILRNCRAAMAAGGRVLVVDHVVPAGNRPDWGKLLDINMLVLTGGRERTRAEFADLFRKAGLRLKRVVRTASRLSILEGEKSA